MKKCKAECLETKKQCSNGAVLNGFCISHFTLNMNKNVKIYRGDKVWKKSLIGINVNSVMKNL